MTTVLPDLLNQLQQRKVGANAEFKEEEGGKQQSLNRVRTWSLARKFKGLQNSTQTYIKRVFFGALLISFFLCLLHFGLVLILPTVWVVQITCFHEIISIAYKKYDITNIGEFRYIAVYFLIAANLYFFTENVGPHFNAYYNIYPMLGTMVSYNRFTSFCFYFFGVMWFVVSLKKKQYRKQFALLAWTHVIILVVVVQTVLGTRVVFNGKIWFAVCIVSITINDTMAFICGKLFGRHPLIQLSPKKTWEGFIGAAFFTILATTCLAYTLCENQDYVCPIEYRQLNYEVVRVTTCTPNAIFKLQTFTLAPLNLSFTTYPFVLHTFSLSVFASVIAPFGGFFASGFKRAFKIKDFGDMIPGHGGIMDRLDCQLVMFTFADVYITSFIGSSDDDGAVHSIFNKVLNMESKEQLELFYLLKWSLNNSGFRV